MKNTLIKLSVPTMAAVAATFLTAAQVNASSVACEPDTGAFDTYVNCGTFIEQVGGNDAGGPITILGTEYAQIGKWDADSGNWASDTEGGWSVTGTPGDNGTWTSAYDVLFMVVKAGSQLPNGGYTVYGQGDLLSGSVADGDAVFSGASTGFWATAPELLGGSGDGRNVSHISFYGVAPTVPNDDNNVDVPETSSLALLALGIAGVGLSRRRLAARK